LTQKCWATISILAKPGCQVETETRLELLFFEDLPLGGEWTTRRRTITEADLSAYSGLSGDFNPLHSDAEYARATHFGGVIAQGSLISAIAIGLGAMDVPVPANMGQVGMSWKYVKPVRPGDTIGTRWRLNRKRNVDADGWGLAVWQIDVLNQHGDIVASGEIARVVARRDAPKPEAEAEAAAAEAAPARSRRRRGRRSAPAGAAAAESVMVEPVPEPAPADAPPPAARRRRGRRSSAAPAPAEPAPAPAPLEGAEASTATPGAAPRRRRRRRSGGGGGNSSGGQDAAPSEPAPAAPEPAAASGGRGLGGVLRRLRGG